MYVVDESEKREGGWGSIENLSLHSFLPLHILYHTYKIKIYTEVPLIVCSPLEHKRVCH